MGTSGTRLDPTVVHAAAVEAVEGLDLVVAEGGKVPETYLPARLADGQVVVGDGSGNVPEERLPERLSVDGLTAQYVARDEAGKVPELDLPDRLAQENLADTIAGQVSAVGAEFFAPRRQYVDAPWDPVSGLYPRDANLSNWALWGSSTTFNLGAYINATAAKFGATRYNGGVGGNTIAQIIARFDAAPQYHADLTILCMGKNDLNQYTDVPARVAEVDATFDRLAPLVKKAFVMGHYLDAGTAADAPERPKYDEWNDLHRARYGARFIDLDGFVTGPLIWLYSGMSPTGTDEAEQALGNVPPSMTTDNRHMIGEGYAALAAYIGDLIDQAGWYPPRKSIAVDTFSRVDGALAGSKTEGGGLTWAAGNGTASIASKCAALTAGTLGDIAVDTGHTDVTLSTIIDGQNCGLFFRGTSAAGFPGYVFAYSNTTGSWRLLLRAPFGSTHTTIAVSPAGYLPYAAGRRLSVELAGDTITCKVDGMTVIKVNDTAYAGTRHGLAWFASSTGKLDDFTYNA